MSIVSRFVSQYGCQVPWGRGSAFATGMRPAALICLLLGMFLAFAAVWPSPGVPGAPARIPALHLPGWLTGSLVIALAAAALSLLASLLPVRRRGDPEDFVPEPPPPPKGGWVAGLALFALLLFGAAGTVFLLFALDRRNFFFVGYATQAMRSVWGRRRGPSPLPAPSRIGMKTVNFLVMFGSAAATFTVLAFAAWMAAEIRWQLIGFGHRRPRRGRLAKAIAEAVESGLADLVSEGDPRQAVIACHRRCEAAVASATHRRYAWQTPREYLAGALDALSPSANPVTTLLDHFERARFGNGPIGTRDRDAAANALEKIRATLWDGDTSVHGGRHGSWR